MLAIKSLISEKNMLPTIIFDEIDNGISGDISGRVGAVMAELSERMQVIAITHLPQIAGKGTHHYRVYKESTATQTRSLIEPVKGEERLAEITKMFSGEDHSATAKEAAREFLQNNN
jgi:DNA repair protein RecN (Recombination protein N)